MRYLRWTAAWIVYYLGHWLSYLTDYFPTVLYPIENRLLCWSSSIQGDTDFGPWKSMVGTDANRGL